MVSGKGQLKDIMKMANCKPKEFTKTTNKREGPAKSYYEDGKLKAEFNYKDGKQNGPHKAYYTNGQLKIQETYKNNKLEGPAKIFYADGKLQAEITYKNGKSEKTKAYDKDGKLKAK